MCVAHTHIACQLSTYVHTLSLVTRTNLMVHCCNFSIVCCLQFNSFKKGFGLVIRGTSLINMFRPEELEQLICGLSVSACVCA